MLHLIISLLSIMPVSNCSNTYNEGDWLGNLSATMWATGYAATLPPGTNYYIEEVPAGFDTTVWPFEMLVKKCVTIQ